MKIAVCRRERQQVRKVGMLRFICHLLLFCLPSIFFFSLTGSSQHVGAAEQFDVRGETEDAVVVAAWSGGKTTNLPNVALTYRAKTRFGRYCTKSYATVLMPSGWMPSNQKEMFYTLSDDGHALDLELRPSTHLFNVQSLYRTNQALRKIYKKGPGGVDHPAMLAMDDVVQGLRSDSGELPSMRCRIPLPEACVSIGTIEGYGGAADCCPEVSRIGNYNAQSFLLFRSCSVCCFIAFTLQW